MSTHGSRRRGLVGSGLVWLVASALGYALVVLACATDPGGQSGETEDAGDGAVPTPSDAPIDSDAADAGEDARIPRFKDGDCSSDSWCTMVLPRATRPIDNPYTIYGLWATAANDVWAVGGAESRANQGELAIVLHYDGTTWSVVYEKAGRTASPYSNRFARIFAASANDLWVSGSGPPLHILRDTHGTLTFDTSDVPHATDGGLRLGVVVGGRGPDDVWAVSNDVFRRVTKPDGGPAGWTRIDLGLGPNLKWEHIAGIPGDNRLAMVGLLAEEPAWDDEEPKLGRLARFAEDGGGLVIDSFRQEAHWWGDTIPSSLSVIGYDDLWHARGDVRHLSLTRDAGSAGDPYGVDAGAAVEIYALTRSPESDHHVWVGGEVGTILFYDGTSFTRSSTSVGGVIIGGTIYTLFALSDKDVWAGGDNVLMRRRVP